MQTSMIDNKNTQQESAECCTLFWHSGVDYKNEIHSFNQIIAVLY